MLIFSTYRHQNSGGMRRQLVLAQSLLGGAELAARAAGRVWESAEPLHDPSARALAPDRFRVVGARPRGGYEVEPTVHDGYLAVLPLAGA